MGRFDLLVKNFDLLGKELVSIREQVENEKDEFFDTIVEQSPNFVAILQDQKYVFLNAQGLKLLKCRNLSEIIGKDVLNSVHPDCHNILLEQQAETTSNNRINLRFICHDGSILDFEGNISTFSYKKRPAVMIVGKDITEDLKQNVKIKQEQQLRADILNSFNEVVALYEPNHQIKWLNRAGKEQLGYEDDSYIGQFCYKVWFGKNAPCSTCPVVTKTNKTIERIVGFPDETIWLVRHIPMFNENNIINGYIEFRENVTIKEKIKKELEESHIRLDKAEFAALLGHFEIDLNSKGIIFSKGAMNILDFLEDNLLINNYADFLRYIHPDDRSRVTNSFFNSFTKKEKFEQIFKIIDASGKIKTLHGSGNIIEDEQNKKNTFFCTVQDISQIQALKTKITNEEIKYKLLAENSPVGVCMIYRNELVYANKTFFDIIGYYSVNEFNLIDLYAFINQSDRNKIKEIVVDIISGIAVYPIRLQIQFNNKNEIHYILKLILTECIIDEKPYIQIIIIDLTKEFEIEKRNKQITLDSLYVNQKNKILHEIETELKNILNKHKALKKNEFNNVFNIINSYNNLDKDWEILKSHFEEIHSSFFQRLQIDYPTLTVSDLKHCACIKLNFTTKEIARFFNIKVSSVQIARVRLKKKMNLSESVDLRAYILSI